MNPTRATEILRSLADGLDPATGQPFPPDSPYQQADTVRALHAALDALAAASGAPAPAGEPPPAPIFGAAANSSLERSFSAAQPFASPDHEERWLGDIAMQFGCSKVAIRARMVRLGLIPTRSAFGLLRPGSDPAKPAAGQPWTPEEEQRLKDAFTAQTPLKAIAAAHGRTPGSITARLLRLGLLDPATTRAPFAPAPPRPQSTAPATSHPPPVPSPSPTVPPPDRPTVPPPDRAPPPPKPDDDFPF